LGHRPEVRHDPRFCAFDLASPASWQPEEYKAWSQNLGRIAPDGAGLRPRRRSVPPPQADCDRPLRADDDHVPLAERILAYRRRDAIAGSEGEGNVVELKKPDERDDRPPVLD
jgi:hypothetical protein